MLTYSLSSYMRFRTFGLTLILAFCVSSLSAQKATDPLGIWYMYFGTHRLSDKLSIHNELQHRHYDIPGDFNQLLTRLGINYHHSSGAIFTTGIGYIRTQAFDIDNPISEFRIWQEMRLRNRVGRVRIGHRYRFEERWVEGDFSTRARYRIIATIPLTHKDIQPGTLSFVTYDEIFINISDNPFSQNRLYFALGLQLSETVGIQAGYLYNRIGPGDFHRLQTGLFWNPDLRKGKE